MVAVPAIWLADASHRAVKSYEAVSTFAGRAGPEPCACAARIGLSAVATSSPINTMAQPDAMRRRAAEPVRELLVMVACLPREIARRTVASRAALRVTPPSAGRSR